MHIASVQEREWVFREVHWMITILSGDKRGALRDGIFSKQITPWALWVHLRGELLSLSLSLSPTPLC